MQPREFETVAMKAEQQELFTLENFQRVTNETGFLVSRECVARAQQRFSSNGEWAVWMGLQSEADNAREVKLSVTEFCSRHNIARPTFYRAISACREAGLLENTPTGYRLIGPTWKEIRDKMCLNNETSKVNNCKAGETLPTENPVESLIDETKSRQSDCSLKKEPKETTTPKKHSKKKSASQSGSLFGELPDDTEPELKTLWQEVVAEIDSGFRTLNGYKPGWDGRAFKILKREFLVNKHWDLAMWQKAIRNRYGSVINPADPPHLFIPHLVRYASAKLDQFYRPLNGNGANGNGKQQYRTQADELDEVRKRIRERAAARGNDCGDDNNNN